MMHLKTIKILWYGNLAFFFLLTACFKSPQVAFYTLNSQTFSGKALKNISELKDISIGIGSVDIPEYLDRPQIVTLKGPHRLHLAEFHRWAGRLNNEITQVMKKNLSTLLGTNRVVSFPWDQSETPEFRVDLTFNHFEGTLGKALRIQGVWRLSGKGLKGAPLYRRFDQTVAISGPDYEDLTVACSKGLWDLSQVISKVISGNMMISS
jgi:uncharacterized lipoprotein YmbA